MRVRDDKGNIYEYIVVEYSYDSWGNVLSITGSLKDSIGVQNPFRYRGYYYDVETGMYYLRSRYYDSEIRRFINIDSYMSIGKGILDTNMFIYCENNLINRIDSNGYFAKELWNTFKETMQGASGYFAASIGVSQIDTALPGPADIIAGGMILGGFVYSAGYAMYSILPNIFSKSKEKTKIVADTLENSNNGNIYYHVTTPERALMIMESNVLIGSEQEGGYVFAWKQKPNKYAIKNSGASFGTIISFKTNAAFERDWGIDDSKINVYEPVISVFPGPIVVWDVNIIG